MSLKLGDIAPDFEQDSTHGPVRFHDWLGERWGVLFSHPKNFTPVCTTEMGRTAQLAEAFAKRNVKPLGLSTDTVEEHVKWIEDVNDTQNTVLDFPIVADPAFEGGHAEHAPVQRRCEAEGYTTLVVWRAQAGRSVRCQAPSLTAQQEQQALPSFRPS